MRGNKLRRNAISMVNFQDYSYSSELASSHLHGMEEAHRTPSTALHVFRPQQNQTEVNSISGGGSGALLPLPRTGSHKSTPRPGSTTINSHNYNNYSNSNGSTEGGSRAQTPINHTHSNNNVFNLNSDGMEHAMPRSSSYQNQNQIQNGSDKSSGKSSDKSSGKSSGMSSHHSSTNDFQFSTAKEVSETTHLLRSHPEATLPSRPAPYLSVETLPSQSRPAYLSTLGGPSGKDNKNGNHGNGNGEGESRGVADDSEPRFWDYLTPEVLVILFIYTVNKAGQELVISSIPLLTREMFSWSQEGGGYYMAVVGASVLPMVVLVNRWVSNVEEREMVLWLSYACLGSIFVLFHIAALWGNYTAAQYILGSALLFSCLNSLEGIIMTLLAKVISPELAKGTFNSGLLATEAGTFGRVLGDCFITMFGVAQDSVSIVNQLFFPLALMVIVSIAMVHWYFERLV